MNHQTICDVFNAEFAADQVKMSGGACEPLYTPAEQDQSAHLYYREDYAASALHEAAHWCIAGARRRTQIDFGYPYLPPPRTETQQRAFFELELRTQTLESLFADAAGISFQVSADNLDTNPEQFTLAVQGMRGQIREWMDTSDDNRARRFFAALTAHRSPNG